MRRILVVDDALFMRQILNSILTNGGFEVCAEAGTAREAVVKYQQLRPDLVTMDIVMPKMEDIDGIGAIREILDFDPAAKILVCSVMGQQSLVMEAIRSGARDFVTKPVQPERLIAAVKKIIGES
jgi:two-component system chemotaxis response regulator CheY